MPSKPSWYTRLDQILADLEALPSPWITRGTVEFLLGVGPRRAQQIMARCAIEQIGTSLVADRRLLIEHLTSLARGEAVHYELERQRKLATSLERLRSDWLVRPKVLVEAPVATVNQRLGDLPDGIELGPGRITVTFSAPAEALERLLALAMAIGNDMEGFEALISPGQP
jgi:hypothetical protein